MNDDRINTTKKFTGKTTYITIKNHQTWGCPVYVLDEIFKVNIYGLPKWETCSRAGICLFHSPFNSISVALVLNPETGHVSYQFNLVFDNDFSTVPFMREGTIPPNWIDLVQRRS